MNRERRERKRKSAQRHTRQTEIDRNSEPEGLRTRERDSHTQTDSEKLRAGDLARHLRGEPGNQVAVPWLLPLCEFKEEGSGKEIL